MDSEVKIISIECVTIRALFGKRYRVNLNQEIYLKYSKTERDFIFVEARDEIEAYTKGMNYLNRFEDKSWLKQK